MASITVSPDRGNLGSTVTVTGTGFDNSSALTIYFGSIPVTFSVATTDGSGDFSGTFVVPHAPAGDNLVGAVDVDGANATADFEVCGDADGDGWDSSTDPALADGGYSVDILVGGNPEPFEGRVLAYAHHDGAHYVAWTDPSGTSETNDPGSSSNDALSTFPPPANHSLNVTMTPDDGGAVVTYELDTNYTYVFRSGTGGDGEGFICQCVYQPLVSADPIWQAGFWFDLWWKPIYDAKFASDGTTLWLAVVTQETVEYPYLSSADFVVCDTPTKDCSTPSAIAQAEPLTSVEAENPTDNATAIDRRYHPAVGIPDDWFYDVRTDTTDDGDHHSGQWSPPRVVMYAGGTGGFTRLGSMDAKFCPGVTGGTELAVGGAILGGITPPPTQVSPRGSFFSGVSLAASEAEPGVCHMVWSEGGDWGTCGGIGSSGGLGGSHGEIFPPAGSAGGNILSNGDFSSGLTNWEPNDTPPEFYELVGDQLRMYCGDSSVWFAGETKPGPPTNPASPDHGPAGFLYRSTDWEPPEGKSIWQMTFTWQRRRFDEIPLFDQIFYFSDVDPMPWGGVGWYPQYPGADPLDDSGLFGSFEASGFGYWGPFLGVGPDITEDLTHYGVMITAVTTSTPDWRIPHSAGGSPIGTSYDYTVLFEIDNVGLSGVPWIFSLYAPLQLYDVWDYPGAPWWYSIGFAYGISNVTLAPYTPDDPLPAGDPNPGDNTGSGSGFDRGPGNRDYRVGYSTWDAGGKTAEYDLFSSHIDRGGFYFPYDFGSGVFNVGYSWPSQTQMMATGMHAVRNDHGSPVLFITWPRVVDNPDQQPDGWVDRGLVLGLPAVEMYDIGGGTPTLLQTLGADLMPTEEEADHYYGDGSLGPGPYAPDSIFGGTGGYGDGITRLTGKGSTIVSDRAFAVSRLYEDPLLGGDPVYLISVPWAQAPASISFADDGDPGSYPIRGFYRVPVDGSSAFDFMDGVRELDFTIINSSEKFIVQTGQRKGFSSVGNIGKFGALRFGSQDFYSDPHNVWMPEFDLQYDRQCDQRWAEFRSGGDGSFSLPNTLSIADPPVWGNDYDTESDTISYITLSQDFPNTLFEFTVVHLCRGCLPCKCAPIGMHVWQIV